jgi:hypothetical protein
MRTTLAAVTLVATVFLATASSASAQQPPPYRATVATNVATNLDLQRRLRTDIQRRLILKEQFMRQTQERQMRVEREIEAFQQQQYQDRLRYNLGIYRGVFIPRQSP